MSPRPKLRHHDRHMPRRYFCRQRRQTASRFDVDIDYGGGPGRPSVTSSMGQRVTELREATRQLEQRAKSGQLAPAHQPTARDGSTRVTLAHAYQDLSLLEYLETPAGHRLLPAPGLLPCRVAVPSRRSRCPSLRSNMPCMAPLRWKMTAGECGGRELGLDVSCSQAVRIADSPSSVFA